MTLTQTCTTELLNEAIQVIKETLHTAALPSLEADPDLTRFGRIEPYIGNTAIVPVLELAGIVTKQELNNLSGSHYDRAYLPTIRYLEAAKLIRPGDQLRDITSGSAGTSLAVLGYALGYQVRITVPDELPENRLHIMRAFADVEKAGPGYVRKAAQVQAAEIEVFKKNPEWKRIFPTNRAMRALIFEHTGGKRVCYLNHSENDLSPTSFRVIAHEAVIQLVEPPDTVALAIGNWTTIAGIAPVLRQAWPKAQLIGYESETSTTYENYGTTHHDSAGTDVQVGFRDPSLVDKIVQISNDDRDAIHTSMNMHRPLADQVGRSSLMGLVVATQMMQCGKTVLTFSYDGMVRN